MRGEDTAGDSISPERYSVAELRAAAIQGKGELSRPLALALLGRVTYPQKMRDLERLLLDEQEVPRLRAMAAQILGQNPTPAALRTLERGLEIDNDVALRAVVQALGAAGGEPAEQALQSLTRRRGTVGAAVKRATQLLRHRAAAPGRGIPEPQKVLRPSPKDPVPIEIRAASGKQVAEGVAVATSVVSPLRFTERGAVSMRCFDRRLLFLFSEEIASAGATRIRSAKAQVGVIVGRKEREDAGWEVKYHVLTQPQRGGRVAIRVTSGKGRLLYSGTAQPRDDRLDFTLRSVDQPGVAAIDVRGSFHDGKLAFSEARSDPRRRRKSPQPKPLREE